MEQQEVTAAGTVGARLRAAREAAGLSVEQVWHLTRVRPAIVHDLEADRFDTCGGAVYARGHLRAVARAVGIDPCPLVQAFDEQTGSHPPTLRVAPPAPVPRQRRPSDDDLVLPTVPVERRGRRWRTAVVASLAVFAGLMATGVLGGDDAPPTSVTAAAPTASPRPSASPAPPPPPAAPAGAALVVAAQGGASWINVSAGGRTLFEGTVQDGWRQAFQDPEQLRVRIGNAAALALTCAGKELGPTGGQGAVRTVLCGPDGVVPA